MGALARTAGGTAAVTGTGLTVAGMVLGGMPYWQWQGYLRARCSIDRNLAVRLGQDVRYERKPRGRRTRE
jgi:hypothetical protein